MTAKLIHVLNRLQNQIDSSIKLVKKIESIGIPQIQLEIINELSFLRIFIAWENFLEESFIRYMVGAISPNGYEPNRLINFKNMDHALRVISAEKEFPKWNSANMVISRSELYFKDGEPYKNVLQSTMTDFNDMNTVRNRIAHKSKVAKDKFNKLVRRKFGYGIRGMTPGRFLFKQFNNIKYIEYYIDIIKTTSNIILH